MTKKNLEFLKDKWVLQPFLLTVYVLMVNAEDFGFDAISWKAIILLFAFVFCFWWIVYLFFYYILKEKIKSCYTASYVVFTIMLFSPIYETVYFISWLRARHIIIILTLTFIGLFILSLRDKKVQRHHTREKIIFFLNLLFIILNVQLMFKIITSSKLKNKISENVIVLKQKKDYPDIYLIILDGYANTKNLQKYWCYYDTNFTNQLSQLGFYNVKNSKSNYAATIQTVSSLLNLNYLHQNEIRGEAKILNKIKNNETVKILEGCSYQTKNFSLFDINKEQNKYAIDIFSNSTSFFSMFFSKSIFYYLVKPSPKKPEELLSREIEIKNQLEKAALVNDTFPKFIYYHSMLTHFPYYLNGLGEQSVGIWNQNPGLDTIQNWQLWLKEKDSHAKHLRDSLWMQSYLNHLIFTNNFGLSLIKNLLNSNKKQPIIIVMSDHGFRFLANQSIKDVENERYDNFCAIYFPDKNYKTFYDSITPVNVMRTILNKALSTNFERLPDKSGL